MARSCFVRETVWSLIPLHSPALLRACAGCHQVTPYHCTDKFRVNGNKRRLDVWLIYRCRHCDSRWNATIHERVSPGMLSASYHDKLMRNDVTLAHELAFDPAMHRAWRTTIAEPVIFRLERSETVAPRIRIETLRPNIARLDRVLARGLDLSRSAIKAQVRAGELVLGGGARALRRFARDGEIVCRRDLSGFENDLKFP